MCCVIALAGNRAAPALRIASCDAPPASEEEELRLDSSNAPATCDQVVGGVLAPLLHLHLNLLVCHGLAKNEGGEERSAKGKGDTHEGWRFLPPPFGLGPHFFWLITRESESEVCLFCDLL